MTQGDIVYHKLTGQELIIIEDIEDYELANNETLECRYRDNQGVYQSADFYGAELTTEMSARYKSYSGGPSGCGGNCRCGDMGGGGGVSHGR